MNAKLSCGRDILFGEKEHRLTDCFPSSQYVAAVKTNNLDSAAKAVSSLSSVLKSDPKLSTILAAPTLSDSDKSQIIAELEKHTGGADKSGTVKNLLAALAENNRLGLLEGVTDKFTTLIGAARGELELTITSATVRRFLPLTR